MAEVYNGRTAEEWYTKYCQAVLQLDRLRQAAEKLNECYARMPDGSVAVNGHEFDDLTKILEKGPCQDI